MRHNLGTELGALVDFSNAMRRRDARGSRNRLFTLEYENFGLDLLQHELSNLMTYQDARDFLNLQERIMGEKPITHGLIEMVVLQKKELLTMYCAFNELTYPFLCARVDAEKERRGPSQ